MFLLLYHINHVQSVYIFRYTPATFGSLFVIYPPLGHGLYITYIYIYACNAGIKIVINPPCIRRRVTVLVSVQVCVSVCVSVKHLWNVCSSWKYCTQWATVVLTLWDFLWNCSFAEVQYSLLWKPYVQLAVFLWKARMCIILFTML